MKPFLIFLFLLLNISIFSQEKYDTRATYSYNLVKTIQPIEIDGVADDIAWQITEVIPEFRNHFPSDSGVAKARTTISVTYDDENVYVLAICYDNGNRVIQSLRRDDDNSHWDSDNFTVVLDPMNNKQNGFMFGVNAGGAQIEAQLNVDGARTQYDANWDNKWYSAVERLDNKWVVEMAIPFKTLRYADNISNWGVNFIRGDMERNEYSTWTEFPLNYPGIDLNYMGTLTWDIKPTKTTGKVVVIPYVTGGSNRDFEDTEQSVYQREADTGIDAKISLTGSLNLDMTINPDFSNVDVDQQVTNLSRFSIFLPERRNFFLENGDVFSNFGGWDIQPFFSRRIGLMNGKQVPITYGGRLTGNLARNTRIGVMNVQSGAFDETAAQNYSVMALHQKVLNRSVIKGIFINRQAQGNVAADQYARNGGVEFAYVSKQGTLNNTIRYHTSSTDERLGNNHYYGFEGRYNVRSFRAGWSLEVVGTNYITDLGFNPRLYNYNAETDEEFRQGYSRANLYWVYRFYPKASPFTSHGFRNWNNVWFSQDGSTLSERSHGIAYDFQFRNTGWLSFQVLPTETDLPAPTSLIGNDTPLPANNYQFTQYLINYETDRRKLVSGTSTVQYGDFFSGTRFNTSLGVNVRFQPWGTFGLSHDFNEVHLNGNYGSANIHLLKVNAQISFTNKMFWTTAVQLNTQAENYNFFSRFQWRFKPMSDFFIVYTDNYSTDGLQLKNRQLVMKLTYWLNM